MSKSIDLKKQCFELFLVGFLVVMYYKNIMEWIDNWLNFDSFYAFGIFMLVFIGYLVKKSFNDIKNTEKTPSKLGILFLIAGFALYVAGNRTDYVYAVNLSLPCFISGIILALYGQKVFKMVLIPIFLFTMCIPTFVIGRLTLPLQLLSSEIASSIINFLGVHSFNEGNILLVNGYKLSVTPGCSGLKSVYSLFFLSIIYAYFINAGKAKKALFILASLPVAMSLNVLRIITVGFYALYNGYEGLMEFHDGAGIVAYIAAIGIILCLSRLIEDNKEEFAD